MENKFHSGHHSNSWKPRTLEFSETSMCLCREMFLRILRVILIFVHRHALVIRVTWLIAVINFIQKEKSGREKERKKKRNKKTLIASRANRNSRRKNKRGNKRTFYIFPRIDRREAIWNGISRISHSHEARSTFGSCCTLGRRCRLRGSGEKANRFNRRMPNTAHLHCCILDIILTDVKSCPPANVTLAIRENNAKAASRNCLKIEGKRKKERGGKMHSRETNMAVIGRDEEWFRDGKGRSLHSLALARPILRPLDATRIKKMAKRSNEIKFSTRVLKFATR